MKKLWALLPLVLVCCETSVNHGLSPVATTTLTGSALLVAPLRAATVSVHRLTAGGIESTPLAQGETDAHGNWTLAAQSLSLGGPVLIRVTGAQMSEPLTALVNLNEPAQYTSGLMVTSITHLTAGYAMYLQSTGVYTPESAIAQAQTTMDRHFGGLVHGQTRLWVAPERDASAGPVALTRDVQAYLFNAALDHLASRYSAQAGLAANTVITLQTLTWALYEDVAADGRFDGLGYHGAHLKQQGVALSGDTLRHDLAVALARFVETPDNLTHLGLHEVDSMARALAASQGPLFEGASHNYDDQGPQLVECTVQRQNHQKSQLSYPQRGAVDIHCRWHDPHGVVRGTLAVVSINPQSEQTEEQAVSQLRTVDSTVCALVDTEALSQTSGTFDLLLSAENSFGVVSVVRTQLYVDNVPPQVTVRNETPWVGADGAFHLSGESDKALRRVSIAADELAACVQEYDFDNDVKHFDMTYVVPCNHAYVMHVALEDWSGETTTKTLTATCDQTAPVLLLRNSFFRQEASGVLFNLADATWPVTFEKLYNRFDYLPDAGLTAAAQNLPTLVFQVDDTINSTVGVKPAELRVAYRYTFVNQPDEQRDWETLAPDEQGTYQLPLSYQTLLPHRLLKQDPVRAASANFIAMAKSADQHLLEVQVTDVAGNAAVYTYPFYLHLIAPPVFVTDCRATNHLLGVTLKRLPSLQTVYRNGFDLFEASIVYTPDLVAESLAPRGSVVMRASTGPLVSRIPSIRISQDETPENTQPPERVAAARNAITHCGDGVRLGWEDESCHGLPHETRYPQLWEEAFKHVSTQDMALLAYAPHHGLELGIEANNRDFEIFEQGTNTLRWKMNGHLSMPDGNPLSSNRLRHDIDAKLVLELMHRVGFEADNGFWVSWTRFLVERRSIAAVEITRPPLQIAVASTYGGIPQPSAVHLDASCQQPLHLRWTLDVSRPTTWYGN